MIALIDFVVSVMEKYYQRRIERFAFSRDTRQYLLLEQSLKKSIKINENDIFQVDLDFYSVQSASKPGEYYYIDVISGTCSCPMGLFGSFCKHQAALYRLKKICLPNLPAVTGIDRHQMAILAKGTAANAMEFYRGLNVSTFIF